MLTRGRAGWAAAMTLLIFTVSPSSAGAAPAECKKYNQFGVCIVWVNPPPAPPPPTEPPVTNPQPVVKPPGGGTGQTVVKRITINGQQCTPAGKTNPQPDLSDPVWDGKADGAIYDCEVPAEVGPGLFIAPYTVFYWAAEAPKAPPPPDPRVLAQQAVDAMQLTPIAIGVVPEPRPGSIGLVGLPNYMWVRNPTQNTYGPITKSAAAGGFTVTATARVDHVVWDMGDGPSITCGQGTPYEARFGKEESPTCGHVYTRQGRYPVMATSYWVIDWAGIGQAGTINLDLTQNATLTIGEAQVISQ